MSDITVAARPELLRTFDRVAIINLPERDDRRREMRAELAALGVRVDGAQVRFVRATRPRSSAGFPSVGAHGCYLSHLATLRQAHEDGVQRLLVLEDDAMFGAAMWSFGSLAPGLAGPGWDMAYLGHTLAPQEGALRWLPCQEPVQCLHCYAVNGAALPGLIAWLEACLKRPPGDPAGGPMHVDGALSMWRAAHPALRALRASRSLAGQRSSRSDIIGPSWLDRLPVAAGLRRLRNRWRRLRERGARP